VKSLKLLDAAVPHTDVVLQYLDQTHILGLDALYFYAFTLKALGCRSRLSDAAQRNIRALRIAPFNLQSSEAVIGWLNSARMILRLQQEFGAGYTAPDSVDTVRSLSMGAGYGSNPNLQDTCDCLHLLALLGQPDTRDSTRAFVDSLQISSFGFTMSPDSLQSNVHVIYAGIWCCRMLDIPVKYRRDALDFVAACQSSNGGFARMPDSLPDMETTRRALQILTSSP